MHPLRTVLILMSLEDENDLEIILTICFNWIQIQMKDG